MLKTALIRFLEKEGLGAATLREKKGQGGGVPQKKATNLPVMTWPRQLPGPPIQCCSVSFLSGVLDPYETKRRVDPGPEDTRLLGFLGYAQLPDLLGTQAVPRSRAHPRHRVSPVSGTSRSGAYPGPGHPLAPSMHSAQCSHKGVQNRLTERPQT